MKKLIKYRLKALALLALLLSYTIANAQNFTLSVRNLTQTTTKKLEFDVYMLNTNSSQPFELATCQLGFLFNSLIYTGGTVSVAINNAGSGLNAAQVFSATPSVASSLSGYPNQTLIRLAGRTPPGAGNGTIISTVGYGTLITHYTITSTVDFTANTTPNITFTSSTASSPLYATSTSEYIGTVNTILTVIPGTSAIVNGNPILNVTLTVIDGSGKNNKTIKVYPNPVSYEFVIEIEGGIDKTGFELLNSKGQQIFKGSLFDKTVVQMTDFTPGVYFIKIENGKTFEFIKIVKK